MNIKAESQTDLRCLSFNQQQQFFAAGTGTGFHIFSCEPLKQKCHREFGPKGGSGVGVVEMLFQTNILALVGGGRNPRWPPNEVHIWDDSQDKPIGWLTFKQEVKGVKMRRDIVVVILEESVIVHNFHDLEATLTVPTARNPAGLCALCPGATSAMAVPSLEEGMITVHLFHDKKQHLIKAHESALSALAINLTATRIASASVQGTLIRVFDAKSGQQLQELRRGMDPADICSVSFSPSSVWLSVASDKGTIHVFSLRAEKNDSAAAAAMPPAAPYPIVGKAQADGGGSREGAAAPAENTKSSFSFFSSMLPKYFDSEWSFAQFQLPPGKRHCAFGHDDPSSPVVSLYVIGMDGMFYKGEFDRKEGGQSILRVKEQLFSS